MTTPILDPRRALSLAEALLAVFLLAGGALGCLALTLQATRYQAQSLRQVNAGRVARDCLEQVRHWYSQSNHFVTGGLYDNTALEVDGFAVQIRSSYAYDALSPSRSLELPYATLQRNLPAQQRSLQIQASWGPSQRQQVRLTTAVFAPVVALHATPLVILQTSGAASLASDANATFSAELRDTSNQVIPGVTFRWSQVPIQPGGGTGFLETALDRTGRSVLLKHRYYAGDPHLPYVPGQLLLRVEARYGGRRVQLDSAPINLL